MNSNLRFLTKTTKLGNLPAEWEIGELSDFLERVIDYRGKTPKKATVGIPVLSAKSVKGGTIDYNQVYFISQDTYKKWETRGKPEIGDVLLTTEGPLGQVAQLDRTNVAIAQRLLILRGKSDQLNNTYLMYYLMSSIGQNQLNSRSTGTTVEGIKQSELRKILVVKPPLEEQLRIAKILSDLDSKIELNQKMNKTLEAIAQAIFKHWFIDFEFPNEEGKPYKSSGGEMVDSELGEIPKGWDIKKLSEVANFVKGFGYKGSEKRDAGGEYVFITLNSVLEGGGFKKKFSFLSSKRVKEKYFVREGDIIIPNTEQTKTGRLIGFPAFVEFPLHYQNDVGVFSHHITKVIPIPPCFVNYLWFYLLFHQKETIKYHTGTGVWGLDIKGWINNEYCIIPNDAIVCNFEKISNMLFKRQRINNKYSEILSNTRDRLLPKLMTGKIRVPLEE